MCGIVGVLAFRDSEADRLEEDVKPLVARMQRRGPDDEGIWSDGRRCALGFRRLSILDLSAAGHQPMVSADGRHVLVFNGEIYNYRELRGDLEARGHRFRSTGDAETLLVALTAWGAAALPRLYGMFALALYDTKEQTLLLARDHAGIKPLHVGITSRGVVFGSQYDLVHSHRWMDGAGFDADAAALYFRFGYVPAPFGLRTGATQVAPGECIQIGADGTVQRHAWYEPPAPTSELAGDDAVDAFDGALARAVKRHLVSDVPVGVFLSGGIDSPLVAAEAVAQHGGTLKAFTISVEDQRLDEAEAASAHAKELGVEHIVERIRESDVLGILDDVVAASTEPTADYSMFPTSIVSRLARHHVKVALSGDGGDELFWGYPSRFAPVIGQAPYFTWPRPARWGAIALRRLVGRGYATRDLVRNDTLGDFFQRKHTLLAEPDLRQIVPGLAAPPASFRSMFALEAASSQQAAFWSRAIEIDLHLARVLAKVDRASMYHSLEVRVPLLDREVLDVAYRTDWRTCLDLRTRIGKGVLRASLSRRLSNQVIAKKGFTVPMYDWLLGPLAPLVHELLLERKEPLLGQRIERARIGELYAQLRGGARGRAWGLWLLLAAALWQRKYGASS